MTLDSFSSLFEILFTAHLAYIITDKFGKTSYIAIITEEILRKYQSAKERMEFIQAKTNFVKVSLDSMEPYIKNEPSENDPDHRKKFRKDFPGKKSLITQQEEKQKQFELEFNQELQTSYRTDFFGVVSFYLTMYCFFVLLIHDLAVENYSFFAWVASFALFSFFPITLSWWYDVTSLNKKLKSDDSNFSRSGKFRDKTFEGIFTILRTVKLSNGYKFLLFYLLASIVLSFFVGLRPVTNWIIDITSQWSIIDWFNNIGGVKFWICIFIVLIPCSNFIIYFIKAHTRGNRYKADFELKAINHCKEIETELDKVSNMITAYEYVEADNLKVKAKDTAEEITTKSGIAVLHHNKSCAFNSHASLSYEIITTEVRSASMHIYDLTGAEKLKFSLPPQQGKNGVEIKPKSLSAGKYSYTLIVNEEEIDSKSLIIMD